MKNENVRDAQLDDGIVDTLVLFRLQPRVAAARQQLPG
jgi:hypothetical protein